jgi:hypothetical protein
MLPLRGSSGAAGVNAAFALASRSPGERACATQTLSPEERDAKAKAALTPAAPLLPLRGSMALEKPREGVQVSYAMVHEETCEHKAPRCTQGVHNEGAHDQLNSPTGFWTWEHRRRR